MMYKPSEMLTFSAPTYGKWDSQLALKVKALSKAKQVQLIYKGTKICLPYALFEKLEFMVIQILTFFYIVIDKSIMVLITAHEILDVKF